MPVKRQIGRIDRADVPKVGDEDGAFALLDEFLVLNAAGPEADRQGRLKSGDAFDPVFFAVNRS